MSKSIKTRKLTRIILIVFLCVAVAGSVAMFIIHNIMLNSEKELLTNNGYINPVSVGDYNLNVCAYGTDNPKHTLVGLSGLGMNNYSLLLRDVTDRFAEENKIVFIDRPGYGYSDDTNKPQTVEQIVEDCRLALKNANIPAPYVLLPHSIAGIYSTYWACKYPKEIEGIVYFDGTTVVNEADVFENYKVGVFDYVYAACCKIGYQRLLYTALDKSAFNLSKEDTHNIDKALTWKNCSSFALVSETKLMNRNCRLTYQNLVKTDIPKVYICANGAVQTKDECVELRMHIQGLMLRDGARDTLPEFTDEYVNDMLKAAADYRNTYIYPFAESIGNCSVELVIDDHNIYQSKPDACADILEHLWIK